MHDQISNKRRPILHARRSSTDKRDFINIISATFSVPGECNRANSNSFSGMNVDDFRIRRSSIRISYATYAPVAGYHWRIRDLIFGRAFLS